MYNYYKALDKKCLTLVQQCIACFLLLFSAEVYFMVSYLLLGFLFLTSQNNPIMSLQISRKSD